MSRVRVGPGRSTYGIYVWGAQAAGEDVSVESVGSERPATDLDVTCIENRSQRLRAPASSIFVESWASSLAMERSDIALRGFRLANARCTGIAMGVDGSFEAHEGRIEASHWGLGFLRFSEPMIGPDVVFEDNTLDVFRIAGP